MKNNFIKPTQKQWKRLYKLAARLKKLEPWTWMEETEIFGVENPETKEIGFVSVMGKLGEHLSIGVYLGSTGIYGYFNLQNTLREDDLALFDVPQLQVSFENRDQVEEEDRQIMKKLGLRFRGKQNYPLFRTIKPGFLPWFITSAEAEMLIYAIEQTLEIAPRVEADSSILIDKTDKDATNFLVRFAETKDGKTVWREEMKAIPEPKDAEVLIELPLDIIDQIESFPKRNKFVLEMDLFSTPSLVAEKGKRPYFPKMLVLADSEEGLVLGFELIEPEETPLESEAQISNHILRLLAKLDFRPQEIRVKSDLLFSSLKEFDNRIDIKIRQTQDLRAIEMVKEGMSQFF